MLYIKYFESFHTIKCSAMLLIYFLCIHQNDNKDQKKN